MSVDLKISLGTVNYTDYLHVTASKVSTPSSIAWEDWINVPVTNYNFIIPGLDPENYYIRYYDAATIGALGTLAAELYVNALSGEWEYERRFYIVGGSRFGDPVDGDLAIVDPYLIDKNVTGVFKEAFRYYNPTGEYNHDKVLGRIDILTGVAFSQDEQIAVEIKYKVANTNTGAGGGLYNGNLDVPEQSRVLLSAEVNKRLRLTGTASIQTVTMPLLTTLSVNNGYYFDNSVGGTAIQTKILMSGTNKVRFNGFDLASGNILFDEFWVSRGEHLLLKKFDDNYWEVVTDYKGTNVGEKVTLGFARHANILLENFQLCNADEYPRIWWWLTNVLPTTHYYTVANIANTSSFVQDRAGQFIIDIATRQFRMPLTIGLSEKGLDNFDVYGLNTGSRIVDYPGGWQLDMIKEHDHLTTLHGNGTAVGIGIPFSKPAITDNNTTPRGTMKTNTGVVNAQGNSIGGSEQRVKNIGVIYGRRI